VPYHACPASARQHCLWSRHYGYDKVAGKQNVWVNGRIGMTNTMIDSSRATPEPPAPAGDPGVVRRVARAAAGAAGRLKRTGWAGLLGAVVVLAAAGAAARAATSGSTAQLWVAVAGGAVTLAVVAVRQRLAPPWRLVAVAAPVAATAVLYAASADGWPGRTGLVLGTFAATAVVAAAASTASWSGSRGFWRLVVMIAAAVAAVVPDQPGLHRLGVVLLGVSLLVAVARGFSRPTLRLTAAALLVAGAVALVSIGDDASARASTAGSPSPGLTRAETARAFDDIAAEAASLRREVPCTRRRLRPPDERLCDDLAALRTDADTAATGGDTDDDAGLTVGEAEADLAELRRQLAVRLLPADEEARARVELAEAQAAEDREAADARADAASTEAASPDLRTLVARGADTVVADALEPAVGDDTAARLGDFGWIALALLLVLGYRRLEMLNNRRYGAPIVVGRFVTGPGEEGVGVELGAAFRNRVAELDLREPPPVPGAESTAKPTSDAVAALDVGDVPGPGTLRGVAARVRGLVLPASGITVEPTYARASSGDEHVVTVRLATTQGGRALRARSFARATPQAAAEAAADFVVCDALTSARLTPSWAQWRSDDGAALAPYQVVLADTGRTGPRLPLREQIELLETARAASPGTGLVLVELGHRYDLDERPLDALRTHLTAKALHPRFAQPRYRLAMSLAMLASPVRFAEHWLAAGRDEDRRQIADLLVETGLVAQARRSRWWRMVEPRCPAEPAEAAAWLAQPEPTPGTQRDILKVFLLVARTELRALEWRLSYPGLLAGAARQSERHVWLGLIAEPSRRRSAVHRYRSARWIAELRLALLPAQPGTRKARELRTKVDAMARRGDVGSTALYNAACFTSVLVDRAPRKSRERAELEERAVHHLRRVIRGGMGPVPSSGWLTTDPDLVALQAVPAFNDLVRRLAHDEDRRETAGRG
jgi:hypothetical protein